MAKRLISGAVGISLVLAVIFLSSGVPIVIDIFVALVCAVAVGEFTHAVGLLKEYRLSIPSIVFAAAYSMLISHGYSMIVWYIYTAVILSVMIFFHEKITFKEVATVYSMTVIITFGLSCLVTLKDMDVAHSAFYFVLALALPWLADAGAYFVGVFFGKHKLCPKISPKKTIEGAVGGVVVCVLLTCLTAYIFVALIFKDGVSASYLNIVIISLVGSLLSILGDLSFSLVKRTYNIKDYGNIIPGHGGVLDRFDSVVFVTPFLLIACTYLPILSF